MPSLTCQCGSYLHILPFPKVCVCMQAAAVGGGTTPQKLIEASRGASFNEVLARCLSVGSDQTSPIVKAAAGDEQIIAPFIPIDTGSLGEPLLSKRLFTTLVFL